MRIEKIFLFLFCCVQQIASSGQSLLINEFEAKNDSTVKDNYNEFDDWIEIANVSSQNINLDGYYLTDDSTQKTKSKLHASGTELTISSNGFIIFWADKELNQGSNHVNFKLSGEGSFIGLYSPGLKLVDSVTFYEQSEDVSQGRDNNNKNLWKFFTAPTPGKANTSTPYIGIAKPPVFSQISGCYKVPLKISLSSQDKISVSYTLDNSYPGTLSLVYKDPVTISKTQIIRAISQQSGWVNSDVISHIYFENNKNTLPILAIITDSLNLYGISGIYSNPHTVMEKFCQLKYIKDGNLMTESNAGIRIQGSSSIDMSKKSFRLFFRDSYGNGRIDYPFFGKNNIQSFKKLVLKSGYDDDITTGTGTLLRDALSVELWKKVGGLPQLSSWAVLYLNNWYWGIYDIRESIDENFIMDNLGISDFDLIRFHNEGAELKYGTLTKWNKLINIIKNSNLSITENYLKVDSLLDMDSFITLMAFVQCSQYYSWGWGISLYRENTPNAKFKISIWDTDRAYTTVTWDGFDEANRRTDTYFWANIIPKKLMANSDFKQKYANRINELQKTVFYPDNAIAVLDSLYSIIKPEMPNELSQWLPFESLKTADSMWEANVDTVRSFLRRRTAILNEQIKNYLPPAGVTSLLSNDFSVSAYPNPFNYQTHIKFNLNTSSQADISVYTIDGRIIQNLFHGMAIQGENEIIWNGKNIDGSTIQAGIYLIRLNFNGTISHLKIIKNK